MHLHRYLSLTHCTNNCVQINNKKTIGIRIELQGIGIAKNNKKVTKKEVSCRSVNKYCKLKITGIALEYYKCNVGQSLF